jgi:CRISPR-associated protein Csm5
VNGIGNNLAIEIEVLSPVHVGSGREPLVLDADFVAGDRVYVIDQEWMLGELSEAQFARAVNGEALSRLLSRQEREAYARYALEVSSPGAAPPQLREQLKDLDDDPYLPGSSLKGAVRTAILWAILYAEGVSGDDLLTPGAAAALEQRWLTGVEADRDRGSAPNRDLLRAFRPADSVSGSADDDLELARVGLHSMRGGGPSAVLPREPRETIFVEALRTGTRLGMVVRLDEHLLRPENARRLGLDGRQHWVRGWLSYCREYGRAVIAYEADFHARYGLEALRDFFERIKRRAAAAAPGREAVLPVGWGTGWHGKTIGTLLTEPGVLDAVRATHRLGRDGYPVFPKSRRLVQRDGEAAEAMGWVSLRVVDPAHTPFVPPLSLEQVRAHRLARQEEERAAAPEPPAAGQAPGPLRFEDLRPGMELDGEVRTVKAELGAFVDVGVGRDGLVRIARLAEGFVEDAARVVHPGQRVRVRVLSVDHANRRIELSMKGVRQP